MNNIKTEVIDTAEQVSNLVDSLIAWHAPPGPHPPYIYIDLEGIRLSRDGSLSILTLLLDDGLLTNRVLLIDVHSLGAQAFETAGAKQKTLRDVLQNEEIPKVFFDVRNDSDALFAHFGVALQGVEDVQLMESATRKTTAARKFVSGLAKCVENNAATASIGNSSSRWKLAKEKGERLFLARYGGSYDVFNKRPIPEEIIEYCAGDVQHLPKLRDTF
ncbi:hypothetical protein EJ04DRAFT_401319, partial [Polyplosphaeria fusca]